MNYSFVTNFVYSQQFYEPKDATLAWTCSFLTGEVLWLLLVLCSQSYPFSLLTFLRVTFLSAPHKFLTLAK